MYDIIIVDAHRNLLLPLRAALLGKESQMITLFVLGSMLVLALVFLAIASYIMVDTGQVGATFLFGRFSRVLFPGLNWLIPLFERVEFHSVQTHQIELPTDAENIDRNDPPAPGKKSPYRILHKGLKEATFYVRKDYDNTDPNANPFDNSLPLKKLDKVLFRQLHPNVQEALEIDSINAPLTSEASVVFEWHLKSDEKDLKVVRKSLENFITNVSSEDGRDREEEVRKRADDMVSRVLQEILTPVTLGHATYMSSLFSKIIKERLEILVGEKPADPDAPKPDTGDKNAGDPDRSWGLHVGDAYLKPLNPGKRINEARADAGAAVSNKQKTILDAEAKKQEEILLGEAAKQRKVLDSEAKKLSLINEGEGEAGRMKAKAQVFAEVPEAQLIAQFDLEELRAESYRDNDTVQTYAPGHPNAMLPLSNSKVDANPAEKGGTRMAPTTPTP